MRTLKFLLAAAAFGSAAIAAPPPSIPLAKPLTYADMADLALASPVVAGVTIRDAVRLKGEQAAGVAAGMTRFYVAADVSVLIRGASGLPGAISYLVDVPLDARGRAPKLEKARVLLLAAPVPGRPGELRLARPYAQLPWTDALEQRFRAILTEANSAKPPPSVTGVGGAFHVPGSLPGESETQIFLTTASARPVSLSILRRPDEQPSWAVALGEMVDEAAEPPARDTLLWYRLACFLPQALPASRTAELTPTDAQAAAEDYRLVLTGLGPCARNYGPA